MKHVLLLTGYPGAGKTTLIREVLSQFHLSAGGFYTEELRREGLRIGFKLTTLDDTSAVLAHVDIKDSPRVGRYGVDLKSLEKVGIPAIYNAIKSRNLVIVDEIGKMELLSDSFRKAVMEAIDSGKPLLGTIMLKSHLWADKLKGLPVVEVIFVYKDNHDSVRKWMASWITSMYSVDKKR